MLVYNVRESHYYSDVKTPARKSTMIVIIARAKAHLRLARTSRDRVYTHVRARVYVKAISRIMPKCRRGW